MTAEPPPPPPERHLASHVFNIVVLAIGIVAVAWMIHQVGVSGLRHLFRTVGGWFPVIVALDVAASCTDAAAIRALMSPEARMVSYGRVLAAQLSGVAINLVTPGGKLGEATKITMLVGHAPRARALSSIVLFNLINLYLSVAVLVIGVPLTLVIVDLPRAVAVVAAVATGVIVVGAVAIALVVRRGAIRTSVDACKAIRVVGSAHAQRWQQAIESIDRHLRDLAAQKSPGTRRGTALLCASRAISWTALIVTIHAIGIPISASLIIAVLSVGVVIGWATSIVPLGIGVSEGASYALYGTLTGSPLAGLGVALVNRVRTVALAVIGLIVMLIMHISTRVTIARRAAHAVELAQRYRSP